MNAEVEALLAAVMKQFDNLQRVELAAGVPAPLVEPLQRLLASYIADNHRELRNNLRRYVRVAGEEIIAQSPGQESELRAAGLVNVAVGRMFEDMRSQIPDWSVLPAHEKGEWGTVLVRTYYRDNPTGFQQAPPGMPVASIAAQRSAKIN